MTAVLFIGGWTIGALLTFRPVFRGLWGSAYDPDWTDVSFCLFISAILVGCFWPVAVVFLALRTTVGTKDAARFAAVVGGESSEQKVERHERERKDRERHIDHLERELELGPYAKDPA